MCFRPSANLYIAITWLVTKGVRRGDFGVQTLPISLSTKMHNKENTTFLALLILFFLQWHGLQSDLKQLLKHLEFLSGGFVKDMAYRLVTTSKPCQN